VHPGYGFLSENPDFAEIVERSKLTFIGPRPQEMRLLGSKLRARAVMVEAGLQTLPGSGPISTAEEARRAADEIGYPVILKASAGGGGRGMRVVGSAADLGELYRVARAEAQAAFGSSEVYLEKYLAAPRHIEFQVLGDGEGAAVHLGERECSVQRRHQKLAEEAPSPVVDDEMRRRVGDLVARAAAGLRYRGVGTFELLFDAASRQFYFLEVNTRIQVEHPVTELVTGVDLVQAQIRVALGERLWMRQADVTCRGHALECRINAEDPVRFLPRPGLIRAYHAPGGPGIRVDSAAYAGWRVPAEYDALIAKLIAHAPTRAQALTRMRLALSEYVIEGIQTNLAFHERLLQDAAFAQGAYDTHLVERFRPAEEAAAETHA
jgi:acetyl-CoA carboxylase biotin carboxylase subunit